MRAFAFALSFAFTGITLALAFAFAFIIGRAADSCVARRARRAVGVFGACERRRHAGLYERRDDRGDRCNNKDELSAHDGSLPPGARQRSISGG